MYRNPHYRENEGQYMNMICDKHPSPTDNMIKCSNLNINTTVNVFNLFITCTLFLLVHDRMYSAQETQIS
jgi:hypothetical protein